MGAIQTMNLSGHTFVRTGDLWVSRTPFTQIDWQSNIDRLRADHKRYGILTRTEKNGKPKLHFLSTLETLQDTFGHRRVDGYFGGSKVIYDENYTVAAFEFFGLKNIGHGLTHPVTNVTHSHAQAMCLAIGADLITTEEWFKIILGRDGNRKSPTPNGLPVGLKGEEYLVTSHRQQRQGTVDVEDPAFPTDPETGTRHYQGNVRKWAKDYHWNPVGYQVHALGHSWCSFDRGGKYDDDLNSISPSHDPRPDHHSDDIGFLAAMPAQDSK